MLDYDIIHMFWNRNENAITLTKQRHGKYCYAIAYRILFNKEDSEECLNDTWLKAWGTIPPAQPENGLSVFLGKITRNLSLDRYKANHAKKRGGGEIPIIFSELDECIPDDIDVEKIVSETELSYNINKYLHTLEERECNIFLSRYWFSESIAEISKKYHIKESNVKVILHRTRKKLKEFLIKEGAFI